MSDFDLSEDDDTGLDEMTDNEDILDESMGESGKYLASFCADNQDFSDVGFIDVKRSRHLKKSYEVEFEVHSIEDIRKAMDDRVQQMCGLLGLAAEEVAMLLRHFRWHKERLIEKYMDSPEDVLQDAGIQSSYTEESRGGMKKFDGFMCIICCDEGDLETFALACGHRFCHTCYTHYLEQKIREEGEARRIQCPGEKCGLVVHESQIQLMVSSETYSRYRDLLNRTYVDDHEFIKWCPAPNCDYAIECNVKTWQLTTIIPSVQCACRYRFCFGCGLQDHQPCICVLVKKWLKKCADDSETANWISANTKECPKCVSTIEKNGGCNHMTCRKCKYEFCWVCMGPWSEHGTSWYNCNRFEEKSSSDARDSQAKSRASLERYLHYYNRYANHEQSAKLDRDQYVRTEKRMTQLQTTSGLSWIEVQYLANASSVLQECRETLKWTYAFAFYLKRANATDIFEDNQRDLEMAVETLSELFEKPVGELQELKVALLDKTAYVSNRRQILLEDTTLGLVEDRWQFFVGLK